MRKLALLFVLVIGITVPAIASENTFNQDEPALDQVVEPQAAVASSTASFVPGFGYVYYSCPWGYRLQYGSFVQYQWVFTPFGYQLAPVTVSGWYCTYP